MAPAEWTLQTISHCLGAAQSPLQNSTHLWDRTELRKSHKHLYENARTINIHQAILQDYEDQFENLLQIHSMMPSEDNSKDNPELKVDLDHLSKEDAATFSSIRSRYPSLYSTHKHHVGLFTGWSAKAKIDPAVNCRQKQRGRFLPATAKGRLGQVFQIRSFRPIYRWSR